MFDFRYHTISLIAVFLALVVGLVLGVAIGDKGLVSSAENSLRGSLRADVDRANAHIDDLNGQLDQHERFEKEAFPLLVDHRLAARRIGIVFLGNQPGDVTDAVQNAVSEAGGSVVSSVVVSDAPKVADLADRASGSRFAGLATDDSLLAPFARKVGRQLVRGGNLLLRERRTLFSSSQIRHGGLDGVVVVRSPMPRTGQDARRAKTFEDAFVTGIGSTQVPVVGVETTSTDPSQVGWYHDHDLASVDDVDQLAGQTALVLTLTGIDGSFGVKDTADDILPRVVSGAG